MTAGIKGRLATVEEALAAASAPGGPLSPDELLTLDERQAFPTDAARLLDEVGAARLYVDGGTGGVLGGLFDLTLLVRLLARRDLTIAVGHAKTFLGAVSVWVAGDIDQRERLAAEILDGAVVSWGLTERGHGGDLLACRVRAEPASAGWNLTGEKWLINNATRGHLICVLARTRPQGGPRGFSLFLFDKRKADPRTWRTLPKVPTHGIRGADISGIAFAATPVAPEALIGAPGTGLETTLKALQLTRTMCCGLSLGALDQAIALGSDYVRRRTLYGKRLADIPNIRYELGRAVATRYAAEAIVFAATRLALTATAEMAVVSAITKALVPELCQGAISAIGEVLGLRGFLSADEPYRTFQKLDRDHRVVAIFDGSTAVCRSQLIEHFPLLARAAPDAGGGDSLLTMPTRPSNVGRLTVLSRRCSLVDRLGADGGVIARRAAAGDLPDWVPALAFAALESLHVTRARMAEQSWGLHRVPQHVFDIARDFELCFAAAAACHLWTHGQADPGEGLWLAGALAVIEEKLPCRAGAAHSDAFEALGDRLLAAAGGPVPTLFGAGMAPL
ncbi:acyl-CoA dehydrogenase [Phytohabitans sp. ZYX-F-186]|uniref:Acyl-CoA dehydrogenase n=1 Tax=Phytohabitans maris TaxID=3071409 RepID=A0ABU0ZFW4_9ACTN|nr:acyl-CoA dehydrogenase [Phytohabitans sp. ZYX-F-186]MDQ7905951.1 acyl-CoA dehydrogenase [Phytohabitans sp. ZYX-F-186]